MSDTEKEPQGSHWEEHPHILEGLIEDLQEGEFQKKIAAAQFLAEVGEFIEEAIPPLVDMIQDENWKLQHIALQALNSFPHIPGQVLEALQKALNSTDTTVVELSILTLGRMGKKARPALPQIMEILQGDDRLLQNAAAETLGSLDEVGKEVLPQLLEMLESGRSHYRIGASSALVEMAPASEEVIDALIERLSDDEPQVRENAAEALGEIGKEAEKAIPSLISALYDPEEDEEIESLVAWSLLEMEEKLKDHLPDLLEAVGREDIDLEGDKEDALSRLKETVKEGDWKERYAATLALVNFPEDSLFPLMISLRSDEELVRSASHLVFGLFPKEIQKKAFPRLKEIIEEGEVMPTESALLAIEEMDYTSDEVTRVLVDCLESGETEILEAACMALQKRGKKVADLALTPLLPLAQEDSVVRVTAIEALSEIASGDDEEVLALLEDHHRSSDFLVREVSREALARIKGEK